MPSNKYLNKIISYSFFFIVGSACAQAEEVDNLSPNTDAIKEIDAGEKALDVMSISAPANNSSPEQSGFNVDVISTDEYLNSSKDINQILNATPGIIIRNEGGLGSTFKLSINGLSGNQIRYFIDGIPMEDFGSALTLDNYPINLVQGIQVYKGVIPINLSSDALGGAINIITPGLQDNYTDISYSIGSFNTQRTAINTNYTHHDYYSRISAFWNSSDNDYEMKSVSSLDEHGNVGGTTNETRFHDRYSSKMFSWKNGVINTAWADELSFNITLASNKKEYQHTPKSIDTALGGFYSENTSLISSLNFNKSGDKFLLSGYLLAGEISETYFDTEAKSYRWDGSYTEKSSQRAELSDLKSIFEVKDEVIRANTYGEYKIFGDLLLSAGGSFNRTVRSGHDELNELNTQFKDPKSINKTVLSLNLNYSNTGIGNVFYKNYQISAKVDPENTENSLIGDDSIYGSYDGFGLTYKYQVSDAVSINSSFEISIRLPEARELLGDGIFIRQSPLLEPEKSNNLNFGLKYDGMKNDFIFLVEANAFYRKASDFIRFKQDKPFNGVFVNVEDVRVKGIELSNYLYFSDSISVSSSITYQEIIDISKVDAYGDENLFYGEALPNEPFLFANMKLAYSLFDRAYNQYSFSLSSRFVHEYYLESEDSGAKDDKSLIDSQLSHDFEVSASLLHQTYNVSFAINNILDEEIYDNYRIQKPGRSYALKIRYNY